MGGSALTITDAQRAEAAEIGLEICDACGQTYMQAPGFINDGHQCNENGLEDRFILPAD